MVGIKIGVDFGSSVLRMFVENKGLVVEEPSVVAVDVVTNEIVAFGNDADNISGRVNQNIRIVEVVKDGVIADFVFAEKMLKYYIEKVCKNRIYKPNVLLTVASDISSLEKKTFLDVVTLAGAGRVCIVDGSLASALGCDIDAQNVDGKMVIDIGHNITEISIVSYGEIVSKSTIRMGSSAIDEAIIKHLRRDRDIVIGPHTAREIKHSISSALKRETELALMVSGKSNLDEMPISFEVTSTEIFPFVNEQIEDLISLIKADISNISPELIGDASNNGIVLCGGGALLFDIDNKINEEISIRCTLEENPMNARIIGLGKIMKQPQILKNNGYSFIFKDEISERIKKLTRI